VKWFHITLDNKEIESNGHRSKVELVELVETMKSLGLEVQSYRVGNERLIRAQEEKNQIKNQLLVQDMHHNTDLMLAGMITEDLRTQEVLVDIIIQLDI
jgi:hypothetical protein